MLDMLSLFFELSIFAVGTVSALLGVICSLLTMTGKYAPQINPLVRLTKLCACLFLMAPVVLCLFDDPWFLEENMSSASALYTIFSAAWLFVFVISSIARLVRLPGRKKDGEEQKRPKTLHIFALFFLIVSVALSWLFS
ncbi:MAG: hypothetical protein E7523_04465 [Ruminococcaceae bacterium]|nr:hypothetical protein [Oscillospiraceae bacterium]